jgi:hypothetical protein
MGQEWMFGLTEAPFVGMHSNYSTALLLKNTVGFCIDAGDLEQWFFNKRNRCYKSGYWVIC